MAPRIHSDPAIDLLDMAGTDVVLIQADGGSDPASFLDHVEDSHKWEATWPDLSVTLKT